MTYDEILVHLSSFLKHTISVGGRGGFRVVFEGFVGLRLGLTVVSGGGEG